MIVFLPSSGISALDKLLVDGYPDKSAILVTGAPGIGKQALCYWFIHSGLLQDDFCLYITRLSTREVLKDAKGFGVDFDHKAPNWISSEGSQIKYDYRDLAGLSFNIKELLKKNADRRIRVVADVFSPLLMLNPPDRIYKFLMQLFAEIKQYDMALIATLEDGMHDPQVMTAMQALFDGVLELRIYDEGGLSYASILKVLKMIGVPPQPGYFSFSLSKNGMEISAYAKHI
jgi:KaiC/GvpD/RAD55 family RecA-like ATPase